jgi:N utilization substance protein A
MTADELAEVPGIGEKTIEKISVAVRHYFGQYEEGEERPVPLSVLETPTDTPETSSMSTTPEEIIANERATLDPLDTPEEIHNVSTEDIAALEDRNSDLDGFSDADNRESGIELENDAVDTLVAESQEFSDETADIAETTDGHDRG